MNSNQPRFALMRRRTVRIELEAWMHDGGGIVELPLSKQLSRYGFLVCYDTCQIIHNKPNDAALSLSASEASLDQWQRQSTRAVDEASVMLMRIIGLEPQISGGIKSRDTTATITTTRTVKRTSNNDNNDSRIILTKEHLAPSFWMDMRTNINLIELKSI